MNIQFSEVSGHNLESLRLEDSVYDVTNQFQTALAERGEGSKIR
jgi:hypothetical protein